MTLLFRFFGLGLVALVFGACAGSARQVPTGLPYQHIVLSPEPIEQPLLNGPPQTGGMRSGRVVLKTGEAMHRHSTNNNEELLVFLAGRARIILGNEIVTLSAGEVLYVPPQTEHELHNDGPAEVRYIYTVAPAGR